MNISEKYLEALKVIDDWVIVSDWAGKFGELNPELLEKAEIEAANQASNTTGLREIAARISSNISRGAYIDSVEIDDSERPRKVRYVRQQERKAHIEQEISEDIAPLRRTEKIKQAAQILSCHERYRIDEFEAIAKQFKKYFGLDFQVDHAQALLNPDAPGDHHPDNLQLLLKEHNGRKNNKNWEKFNLDDQFKYIRSAIRLQKIVASRLDINLEEDVLDSLLQRLKDVY